MNDVVNEQFESERTEFDTIFVRLSESREEYHLSLRTNAEDTREIVRKHHEALEKGVEALNAWISMMRAKIQQVFVTNRVSAPKSDDPAWKLIRQSDALALIRSLMEEKRHIKSWLEARS